MSLRPGGKPAKLLLDLWQAQAEGCRWPYIEPSSARERLISLELIRPYRGEQEHIFTLTPAGREAAQALLAGS